MEFLKFWMMKSVWDLGIMIAIFAILILGGLALLAFGKVNKMIENGRWKKGKKDERTD